jgi:hygromycin-B 7''-O-kinase
MLPATLPLDAYRPFRRDVEAQRPAIETIAARHGLPRGELAPFSQGTQIVWGTQRSVIKLFVPTWPEDTRIEMLMLERLVGAGLPVPQLEARGEVAGWPYVVMSRLPGQRVPEVWPGLDAGTRERLAHDIGAAMTRLAALPVTGLDALRAPQELLLAERRPRLLQDQRERGGDDALEAQLQAFLDTLPPLLPAESVLLHADLTADNILVHDGRLAGFIDFADAFVGPWTYELAATSCFVTQGDRRSQRALLLGRGVEATPELLVTLRCWAVLHRYGHVAIMMRHAGHASLWGWLDTLWLP